MIIYIKQAVIIMFLLLGLDCLLLGYILGRPKKPKENAIGCGTCRNNGSVNSNPQCVKCITSGLYFGYQRAGKLKQLRIMGLKIKRLWIQIQMIRCNIGIRFYGALGKVNKKMLDKLEAHRK